MPAETVERLADEFTSHGRAATASFYRGAAMHSMGIYAGLAIHMLNALIGNFDRKGGMMKNPGAPDWLEGTYDLETVDGAPEHGGVHVSRVGTKSDVTYEETTEYRRKVEAGEDPYPSERPWYPFTHAGITTEALSAIATGYPYNPKVYIQYYINQLHSIPGGRRFREVLQDPEQLPLYIAVDTTISETSVYADYIVPDAMYLDGQYGFMGQQAGACSAQHLGIRTPAVEPLTGRTDDGRPMLLETFLIDVALRLESARATATTPSPAWARSRARCSRCAAPRTTTCAACPTSRSTPSRPPATADERAWVEAGYPAAAHRDVPRPRSGRSPRTCSPGAATSRIPRRPGTTTSKHTSGLEVDPRAPLQIWHEQLATTVNPALGRTLPGCATYLPAEDGTGQRLEEIDADYPFQVVTFRLSTRTKARTAYDYWALEIHPRNHVEMNPVDAARLGLQQGNRVGCLRPATAPRRADRCSERVRPGVIAGTHHFGHTQQGTSRLGDRRRRDRSERWSLHQPGPARHVGVAAPAATGSPATSGRAPEGFNVQRRHAPQRRPRRHPLVDNAGGATVFLDSRVKVERI
ncbi:MAG: molybdopterin dinucleotide binding domain-containing protein [Acidimicrobiia bacterium]|nr:molybdopterin dinucleotide binding domain-containing protein [Acidimicrobiia bacterium]